MNYKFIIYFTIMNLLVSCKEQRKDSMINTSDSLVQNNSMKKKPGSSFKDTLLIFENSAVFYVPDSLQKMAIQKITDSIIFKSLVHENFYQMRYSKIVFNKYYRSIKLVEANQYRYLKFIKRSGQFSLVDLDHKDDAYGLFVFDGEQEPQLVDMTNIETELGFYFKKK